jgi:hypothetical protein
MFAGAQAVDEHLEIGVRQGGMGAAKRGHDLDTDRIKGREREDGDRAEPLQAGLAENVDLLVVSREVRRDAVTAPP